MRRIGTWAAFAAILAFVALAAFYVGATDQFPFLRWGPQYSIAIYEGETPFDLKPSRDAPTPAFTSDDVKGLPALLVADPFVVSENDRYYLFFELMDARKNRGEIGWAESLDGLRWTYGGIALQEPFHLSYPQVFRWKDAIYMIPESSQDYSVSLYRADEFPRRWRKVKTLLNGRYVDPSVVQFGGRWWMFASDRGDALRLFTAPSLEGPWEEHRKSPIVTKNGHIARCGGRILVLGDKLYRFAQDGAPTYGNRLWALEIVTMTLDDYQERPIGAAPLLRASGSGWNAINMHHVDHIRVGGKWRAYVDGAKTKLRLTRWWRKQP